MNANDFGVIVLMIVIIAFAFLILLRETISLLFESNDHHER